MNNFFKTHKYIVSAYAVAIHLEERTGHSFHPESVRRWFRGETLPAKRYRKDIQAILKQYKGITHA